MCGVVEHGAPASREEIARHEIIGMDGRMALLPGPQWLKAAAPNNESCFSSNSLMNLVYNFRAGLGVATLPCIIGDAEPDLMRCFAPPPELLSEFWLIVREGVKSAPHVRAFADFLAEPWREGSARIGWAPTARADWVLAFAAQAICPLTERKLRVGRNCFWDASPV